MPDPHEGIAPLDRAGVARWVAGYETAWRDRDLTGVERLFTAQVHYLKSPYEEPLVGHAALRGSWREDDDTTFTMRSTVVAVDGLVAVVRVVVEYLAPHQQEYTDLWVLRFTADGRVEHFEEWAYWPGSPYTASDVV